MSVGGEAGRILAFEREFQRTTTRRTEPFACGTAYLDERFPLRWDSNLLWVEEPLHGVGVQALADEADRVLGGAGIDHRTIIVDDEDAERLAFGLAELGYSRDRLVTMVHRHEPDRRSSEPVEEVDAETFVPIVEEATRRSHTRHPRRSSGSSPRTGGDGRGVRGAVLPGSRRRSSGESVRALRRGRRRRRSRTSARSRRSVGGGWRVPSCSRALSEAKRGRVRPRVPAWPTTPTGRRSSTRSSGSSPRGRWSNFDRAAPAG